MTIEKGVDRCLGLQWVHIPVIETNTHQVYRWRRTSGKSLRKTFFPVPVVFFGTRILLFRDQRIVQSIQNLTWKTWKSAFSSLRENIQENVVIFSRVFCSYIFFRFKIMLYCFLCSSQRHQVWCSKLVTLLRLLLSSLSLLLFLSFFTFVSCFPSLSNSLSHSIFSLSSSFHILFLSIFLSLFPASLLLLNIALLQVSHSWSPVRIFMQMSSTVMACFMCIATSQKFPRVERPPSSLSTPTILSVSRGSYLTYLSLSSLFALLFQHSKISILLFVPLFLIIFILISYKRLSL